MHYFTSKEIVMNSERDMPREDNLRHMSGAMTCHIMELYMRNFVTG